MDTNDQRPITKAEQEELVRRIEALEDFDYDRRAPSWGYVIFIGMAFGAAVLFGVLWWLALKH